MHCRCGSRWVGRSAGRARRARSYRTEARHDPASARPESRSGRLHTAVALSRDRGHRPRTGNLGGWCSRDHSRRAGHASSRPEIPPDSVGGFIYTGGPLQLADLADHGVCYAGHGAEWQGWLCAKETGRYELEVDGSTVSPNNYTSSTCVFAGWLEDRAIGVQEANPRSNVAQPAVFSPHPRRRTATRPLQAAALGDMHTLTRGAQSTDLGRAVGKGSLRSQPARGHRRRSGAQTGWQSSSGFVRMT
jgi:hypothetical protein